jgi:deoxyribonuclease V
MRYRELHRWDLKPAQAIALQEELRRQIKIQPLDRNIQLIAGCDVSFDKDSDIVYAGVVILSLPDMRVVDRATAIVKIGFPYIPGLLSFRETPALLRAWEKLTTAPDAVMLDGQGLAHPRRFGIACHFGLITELITVGCAKTVLVGKYQEPGQKAGNYSPLVDRGEVVGAALRTKDGSEPIFVSAGHMIDLSGAIELTLRCVRGYLPDMGPSLFDLAPSGKSKYRMPEPTRLAHIMVNALRRNQSVDRALRRASS